MEESTSSTLSGKYILHNKLGEGSFGIIYQATNVTSNANLALKIEASGGAYSQLLYEYKIYKAIEGGRILIIRWYPLHRIFWRRGRVQYNGHATPRALP